MSKHVDYPTVPDYEVVPEADDLIGQVIESIRTEVLQPIAEAKRINDDMHDASPTLRQVFGLAHEKVCKTLNILKAYEHNIKEAQEYAKEQELLDMQYDEPPL
ncbi:MAG: hypothetical protein Tp1124SUR1244132_25 [Prokaryotic dsDNA virus sp.]|nr:MAG: hypothetical protein Tp1124SUR1244132_25 [Prokaryotic dsDNA virus sp.]|tara:strand:- start:3640 stop:3948 length:309 start_codon:yes stop_codon:yes gene_type:complete